MANNDKYHTICQRRDSSPKADYRDTYTSESSQLNGHFYFNKLMTMSDRMFKL